MATHSFLVPQPDFIFLVILRLKKHLTRPQIQPNKFICLLDHADEAPLANIKIERQRWPAKPLIPGSSGTQYVAMVTKLVCSYCGAHLVESYCKESSISDANWLRYPFSSYSIKIWFSLWHHHLANLHVLKTWISPEQKEIFEKIDRTETNARCRRVIPRWSLGNTKLRKNPHILSHIILIHMHSQNCDKFHSKYGNIRTNYCNSAHSIALEYTTFPVGYQILYQEAKVQQRES